MRFRLEYLLTELNESFYINTIIKYVLVHNSHEIFNISSYCKTHFISSTLAGCILAAISPNPVAPALLPRAFSNSNEIAVHSGSLGG